MPGLITDLESIRLILDSLVGSAGVIGEDLLNGISSKVITVFDSISNASFDLLDDVTAVELIKNVSL